MRQYSSNTKDLCSIAKDHIIEEAKESEHVEYNHHQWHNEGYRIARSSLTKSTPWK